MQMYELLIFFFNQITGKYYYESYYYEMHYYLRNFFRKYFRLDIDEVKFRNNLRRIS